jgi:NADPH:quinone reductase-like Zn-dependent oxidoreductase
MFPYIPGSTFAGVIEEVGENVTTFTKGQAVFGRSSYGTYTEYTTASIEQITLKIILTNTSFSVGFG